MNPAYALIADVRKNGDPLRINAAILLRGLDARGALTPEGKAVLAKLPAEAKKG